MGDITQLELPLDSIEDVESKSKQYFLATIEQLHRDISSLKKEIEDLEEENKVLKELISNYEHPIKELEYENKELKTSNLNSFSE